MKQPFFLERQKPGNLLRAEPRMQRSQGAASSPCRRSISLPNSATLLHGPPAQAGLKHGASSGMCQLKSFNSPQWWWQLEAWVRKAAKGGKLTWLLLTLRIGIHLG